MEKKKHNIPHKKQSLYIGFYAVPCPIFFGGSIETVLLLERPFTGARRARYTLSFPHDRSQSKASTSIMMMMMMTLMILSDKPYACLYTKRNGGGILGRRIKAKYNQSNPCLYDTSIQRQIKHE